MHVDHVGPFPTTPRKNSNVLGLIDNLTRFVYIESVKDITSHTTVKKLEEFIAKYVAPGRIISDRGTSFTSHKFQEFCLKHGIKHTLNSSRYPQANGLIERVNQTLILAMKIAASSDGLENWDRAIPDIARDINCMISSATGKAPYEALLRYIPRFGEGNLRYLTANCETYTPPQEIQDEIRKAIEVTQAKYKDRYDQYRHKNVKFRVGDIVFMKRNPVATGQSTKLQAAYGGPLVVIGVEPSDTLR